MACSQYDQSSWFTPNSSQPDFTSNYTLDSLVELSWWGDIPYIVSQYQDWRLILGWFNDTDATSALSNGRGEAITSSEGWAFTYGYDGNPSWVMPHSNSCGYTALGMQWAIDPKIDISWNQKFKIYALNKTDTEDIKTVTSPGFPLLPSSVLSDLSSALDPMTSISSSSTTQSSPPPSTTQHVADTSSSGTTQSSHPTSTARHVADTNSSSMSQSSPTPPTTITVAASRNTEAPTSSATGLSKGAKAGIGVGCTLLACLILLGVFLLMRHRRRPPQILQKLETSAREKPELDARAAKRSVPEVRGEERYELDEQDGIGEMEGNFIAVEILGYDYGSH